MNPFFCLNRSLTHSWPKLHRFSFATRFIQDKLSNGLHDLSPIHRALVCLSQSSPTANTTPIKLSCLDIFTMKYVDIQACDTQKAHVLHHTLRYNFYSLLPNMHFSIFSQVKPCHSTKSITKQFQFRMRPTLMQQRQWERKELAHTRCLWNQSARRLRASLPSHPHLRLWKEQQTISSSSCPAVILITCITSGPWCLWFIHHFYSTPACLKYPKSSIWRIGQRCKKLMCTWSLIKTKAAYTPNPYAVHKIYMAVQCSEAYPLEINTHQPVIPSFLSLH